jgi:hypothetical protein
MAPNHLAANQVMEWFYEEHLRAFIKQSAIYWYISCAGVMSKKTAIRFDLRTYDKIYLGARSKEF